MRKWVILLVCLLMIPLVNGICCEKNKECLISETCQDANCGDCTTTLFNRDGTVITSEMDMTKVSSLIYTYNATENLTDYGTYPYTINCTTTETCQGDCHVELKLECEEQEMSGMAITIFVMLINIALFILPFKVRFSNSEFLNHVLKRCSIFLGLLMLGLNTAIVATIAETSDIQVVGELFMYLWIVNWAAYIAAFILFWHTLQSSLGLWKQKKLRERMGDDDDE